VNTAVNLIWKLRIWQATHGQDLVECALMASFVAIFAAAIVPVIATSLSKVFSHVASSMTALPATVDRDVSSGAQPVQSSASVFLREQLPLAEQQGSGRYGVCDLRVAHVRRTRLSGIREFRASSTPRIHFDLGDPEEIRF
jgi:hypothetical protein